MNCKPEAGDVFGRLTIAAIEGLFATCSCTCGTQAFRCRVGNLSNKTTKSCGCLRGEVGLRSKTHGLTKTSYYAVWDSLRQRCLNPNDKSYEKYGGRGISVCARWDSFENFQADMGPKPSPRHSIDRIDNNGNYEPSNCRWATKVQQTQNRSNAINVTYNGETKPLKVWCDELGVNYFTAHRKLRREGKTPSEAFATKAAPKSLPATTKGDTITGRGELA